MVNIDTVYQKVLAIANKEQRGYITPQEFNLFADYAQKDIFEKYFYDVNQFKRVPGNSTDYSNMLNNLEEKISLFEIFDELLNVVGEGGDKFEISVCFFLISPCMEQQQAFKEGSGYSSRWLIHYYFEP